MNDSILKITTYAGDPEKEKPELLNIPLYRGFSEAKHRENFLSGEIWFAGVLTNRYNLDSILALSELNTEEIKNLISLLGSDFSKIQQIDPQKLDYLNLSFTAKEVSDIEEKLKKIGTEQAKNLSAKLLTDFVRDEFEYKNSIGESLHWNSLSLSKTKLENYPFHVKIVNIKDFFYCIKSNLLKQNKQHLVSWHDLKNIKKIIAKEPSLASFDENYSPESILNFDVYGFGAHSVKYDQKIITPPSIYNSLEVANNTIKKNSRYQFENEYRVFINGIFLGNDTPPSLEKLVKYLKIKCPEIQEFCEIVD